MRTPTFILFIMLALASCLNTQEGPTSLDNGQVARLLDGGSSKSWELLRRSENGSEIVPADCDLDNLLAFTDTSYVSILANQITCPDDIGEVLFVGVWEVLDPGAKVNADTIKVLFPIDTIMINDTTFLLVNDSLYWVVEEITSQFLTISFLEVDENGMAVDVLEEYLIPE